MRGATRQANFLLPADLLAELKKTVSRGEQSKVVAQALKRELKRLKLRKALESSFAAWKDADHPELAGGTAAFIRKTRRSTRTVRGR